LKILLDAGDKQNDIIDSKEAGGWTAVMRACDYDNCESLQMLISRRANLEAIMDSNGQTALLMCAHRGRLECARLLIESGANICATDKNGNTAMMLAAVKGQAAIVALFIEHAADVNARNHAQWTALMIASSRGSIDCVRLLVSVNNIEIDAIDNNGITAVVCAASMGRADIMSLLIEHTPDTAMNESYYERALMCAAHDGHIDCVRLLLAVGDTNIDTISSSRDKALSCAANKGYADIVSLLIEHQADVNGTASVQPTAEQAGLKSFVLQLLALSLKCMRDKFIYPKTCSERANCR
jgi:ankyrin repeat protein